MNMYKLISLFSLALSQVAIASPATAPTAAPEYKKWASCYSYTTTVPYTGPVYCPLIPATCPSHPDCIILEETTVTVPGPNKDCPVTPTVTVTGASVCPTCQTGCATDVLIVTTTLM